jgi:hypothetical protein
MHSVHVVVFIGAPTDLLVTAHAQTVDLGRGVLGVEVVEDTIVSAHFQTL